MDFWKALVTVLMMKWGHAAGVGTIDNRWDDKKVEVEQLSQLFVEEAREGALVDPKTDAMILTTIAWFESSLMLQPPDGDPRYNMGVKVGTVVGPMQVSKAAPTYLPLWPGGAEWQGLTVARMREPKVNVAVAYFNLKYRKQSCGGPPGAWIAAYGMGKCPSHWGNNFSIGWEGRRRCKFLTGLMKRVAADPTSGYTLPENWSCSQVQEDRGAH
jgi:hypothetical protein